MTTPPPADFAVQSIRPLQGEYRKPRVIVEVNTGLVAVVFTVIARQGGRLEACLPETTDGSPGVVGPPEVISRIEAMIRKAVAADLFARAHLNRRPRAGTQFPVGTSVA